MLEERLNACGMLERVVGTEVEVRPARKRKPAAKGKRPKAKGQPRSLAERLANVVGKATGLPPDASVNHDHYLYGLPKRE